MFCSKCGKEIPDGSPFCSFCGAAQDKIAIASSEPVKKKFYQKTWFTWVMLLFLWPVGLYLLWKNNLYSKKTNIIISVVILALAAITIFGPNKTENVPSSSTSTVKTQQKKEPPAFTINVEGMGKLKGGMASNVGIAVEDVKEQKSIGNSFTNATAQGKFVIVTVIVHNFQKDAITVDANSFKLMDNQGREYTHSTEGQTALEMSTGNTKGFLTNVNPGLNIRIAIPYDVPTNVGTLQLKAQGGFSGSTIMLPLKVQKI